MGSVDFEAVMNGTYVEPVEVEESDSEQEETDTAENSENE